MMDIKKLITICDSVRMENMAGIRIPEAYIPFFPPRWNGVLVLAEAQNHGKSSDWYVDELVKMPRLERIRRLGRINNVIGIQPWDDGTLKLAVEAAFQLTHSECAISNAVLWSDVNRSGSNSTPSPLLQESSIQLWSRLLPVISPSRIVTTGKIARFVMSQAILRSQMNIEHVTLCSASPNFLSRISGMFVAEDLLRRYKEVADTAQEHPEWLKRFQLNKIFFACHAVSCVKGGQRGC